MRDLPSKGRCHAAFLLAYSARVRRCADVDVWLAAARTKSTYMAAALDLVGTAQILLDVGLARVDDAVFIARDLACLDREGDTATFKAIARLLLLHRPPDWLRAAVIDDGVAAEFIPGADLDVLSWLGSDLEPIIVAVYNHLYGSANDELLKHLGDAGELMVMSALHALGRQPRHVALVSDRFGYDIEVNSPTQRHGVEVKTVVPTTAERILITRNEFDVARRMGNRWKIVQVTLSSQAIARGLATAGDVMQVRELTSEALRIMAPSDSSMFKWSDSAEFRPSAAMWTASELVIPADPVYRLFSP
jgi:hypothetical protein